MDMTSDTNEISNTPVTPFVKSIDGINPDDLAIEITNGGGVTTSLILPGSGNLIGGEAYIIKHRPPKSNLVSDLLIHYKDTESPNFRYVKMACGENAVRSYGRRLNIMPDSRLGEGWLFRKVL